MVMHHHPRPGDSDQWERCLREIAAIEEQLRAGHPDVLGLCRALADWSAELRMLAAEREKPLGRDPARNEEP
jgi:hypothetical protein